MKNLFKTYLRPFKSNARMLKYPYWMLVDLAYRLNLFKVKEIALIIVNFNRLTYLLTLLGFLEKHGFKNIVIVDNNSTYAPLLEFYATCKYQVIRMTENYGHLVLWKSGLYRKYRWNYFVYTDSDVVPVDDCPGNFVEYFKSVLVKYRSVDKVGFGIRIDDLPDSFRLKSKVINYESRYWKSEISSGVYDAPIDTTFALYRPFTNLKWGHAHTQPAFRLGFPFVIRHLPWYVDSSNLTEEESYYLQTSNESSSIGQQSKGKSVIY